MREASRSRCPAWAGSRTSRTPRGTSSASGRATPGRPLPVSSGPQARGRSALPPTSGESFRGPAAGPLSDREPRTIVGSMTLRHRRHARSRRSWTIASGLLAAASLLAVGTPVEAVAAAAESCAYDASTKKVTAAMLDGSQATLVVSGSQIWFGAAPAPCGAATTTNTDSISIAGNAGTIETLILDHRGGVLRPRRGRRVEHARDRDRDDARRRDRQGDRLRHRERRLLWPPDRTGSRQAATATSTSRSRRAPSPSRSISSAATTTSTGAASRAPACTSSARSWRRAAPATSR